MTPADKAYKKVIGNIIMNGERVHTRNGWALSITDADGITFTSSPWITLRDRISFDKALLEMQWILSGDPRCPDKLADWWKGQLDPDGNYWAGYGEQLRRYGGTFDQIEWLIEAIITHPNSRRLITTTWNPEDMSQITELNGNRNTPTTCHGTVVQYFVRNKRLHLVVFQRSADIMLGVPHNWIQYWAYGCWLAHRTGYALASLRWLFGDVHLYDEPSHIQAAKDIINYRSNTTTNYVFSYAPTSKEFLASDFKIISDTPQPATSIRPKLL